MSEGDGGSRTLLRELARLDVGELHLDEPLSGHTTWRIGGPADLLVEPDSIVQVQRLMRRAHDLGIPLVVLGQGSNVLFCDLGVRGIVMKLGGRFSSFSVAGRRITSLAGASLPWLARAAGGAGIGGLEHVVGIPGSLGGLVVMNGGSLRRQIGSSVQRVWAVTPEGEEISLSRDDCRFGYRSSAFHKIGAAVVKVELEGEAVEPAVSRREMLEILRSRRRKFPLKQPNCGSVFLSTPELHAAVGPPGKIIEDAGFKGAYLGGAEVSTKHANFIVNRGGAKACEVLSLIAKIRREIRQRHGFTLCCEVRYVTAAGETISADSACDLRQECATP